MTRSSLDNEFRNTRYVVMLPEGSETICIDHPLPEGLQQWLGRARAESLTLLTSDNPLAQIRADEDNAKFRRQLQAELDALRHTYLPTLHIAGTASQWPNESGFAVTDLSLTMARRLAEKYKQLAFVRCDCHQPAKLVWLDEPAP